MYACVIRPDRARRVMRAWPDHASVDLPPVHLSAHCAPDRLRAPRKHAPPLRLPSFPQQYGSGPQLVWMAWAVDGDNQPEQG